MDENKLKTLNFINYQIRPSCGLCVYGKFARNQNWGTCNIQTYKHMKHNEATSQLSITKFGYCSKFKLDEKLKEQLEGFKDFIKE